jgi:hypothetical protein
MNYPNRKRLVFEINEDSRSISFLGEGKADKKKGEYAMNFHEFRKAVETCYASWKVAWRSLEHANHNRAWILKGLWKGETDAQKTRRLAKEALCNAELKSQIGVSDFAKSNYVPSDRPKRSVWSDEREANYTTFMLAKETENPNFRKDYPAAQRCTMFFREYPE